MSKRLALASFLILFLYSPIALNNVQAKRFGSDDYQGGFGELKSVVKREQRETLVDNEYGRISAVNISDGIRGPYHIRFFTLEPNSLLLPVLLHADVVFYVNTGSGKLSWADEEETKTVNLKRGDIFRLQSGSVFFVQSDLEPERQSLRIYALFSNTDYDIFEPRIGAYSSIRNLVRGFDKIILKQAFQVSDEVIESITRATDTEAIVHAIATKKEKKEKKDKEKKKKKKGSWEIETRLLKAFLGFEGQEENAVNKKKGAKGEVYNVFDEKPDFENCNGWSLTVNPKKVEHALGETNIGIFMVNLTKGSMMGPHWNPKATEIAIVLQGEGMIRVVCSSRASKTGSECRNMRFMVKEGDVFVVPRFHPMAQMSFNNDSLVFMGFTTTRQENHPQFLAGKQSVLRTLDRDILALSFNVPNTTIDQLLAPQTDSLILDCTSCAEEEERKMEEEAEKEKKEEEAREREKEEEERRKREEEEREREREAEERRKKEEEEARKREEEEERAREEEEARKREEEEERAREEEERRKREEEERERERQQEEEARREEEERERERQQEEEARRQEEEQEQKRQEEEEEEEEEARRQEEERERERQQEEEARRQEEEQEQKRQEEEEARRQEKERERERQQEEEARRREKEQEQKRQEEEEERQREKEEGGGGGGGGGGEGRAYVKMWQV